MSLNTPTCEHGGNWNVCTECRPQLKEIPVFEFKDKSQGFIPKRPWSPCIGPDCNHPSHKKQ